MHVKRTNRYLIIIHFLKLISATLFNKILYNNNHKYRIDNLATHSNDFFHVM